MMSLWLTSPLPVTPSPTFWNGTWQPFCYQWPGPSQTIADWTKGGHLTHAGQSEVFLPWMYCWASNKWVRCCWLLDSKMGQLRSCGWAEKSRRLVYWGEQEADGQRGERDRDLEALASQMKSLLWFPKSVQLLVPGLGRPCFLWVLGKSLGLQKTLLFFA